METTARVRILSLVLRLLRLLAVAVCVGALAGLVIAGGASRLAMRLIALADDREDFGRVTSAGATVGDVTAGGTLAVFGTGLVLGILGALLYVAFRQRLPADPRLRALAFAWTIVGLGLLLTVNGNQEDFTFLNLARSLGLFGLTLLLFGWRCHRSLIGSRLCLALVLEAGSSSQPSWSCSRSLPPSSR